MWTWAADGSFYDGQWKNGKKHGIGFYHTKDGEIKKGEYFEDEHVRWIDKEEEEKRRNPWKNVLDDFK